MRPASFALLALLAAGTRPAPNAPTLDYALRVETPPTAFDVELHVRGATDTLIVAMAAHPEYDDRFWRYVRDVHVVSGGRELPIARIDSMLWRAVIADGEATVRYRVEPPPASSRGSWRAYLSATNGLVGGPHSFMYVVGLEHAPVRLSLFLPSGWDAATGLRQTSPLHFAARNVAELLDSPIAVGAFRRWPFTVAGVPHEVAYLSPSSEVAPQAAPTAIFGPDSGAIVGALSAIATRAHDVFGSFPYSRFVYLLEEGAGGALEHASSVNLGILSDDIREHGLADFVNEAAHEYFHSWNEVSIRPRGWGGLSYRPALPAAERWWTEGVTMYYADLLPRRAALPTPMPSRRAQLTADIADYLDQPGNGDVSPEEASRRMDDAPGTTSGPRADVYLQGKLIGLLIDLRVRTATSNRHSLDDVMRTLFRRHRGSSGFSDADVEEAAAASCSCAMQAFFASYVRSPHLLPITVGLRAAGLRVDIAIRPATDSGGRAKPDTRVWQYMNAGDRAPRILILHEDGAWKRAGLETGDRILRWNGRAFSTTRELRTAVAAVALGDSVAVTFERAGHADSTVVQVGGYEEHRVRLVDLPGATLLQLQIRRAMLLDPWATSRARVSREASRPVDRYAQREPPAPRRRRSRRPRSQSAQQ